MKIYYLYLLYSIIWGALIIGVYGTSNSVNDVVDIRRFNQGVDTIINNITAVVKEQENKNCLADSESRAKLPLVKLGNGHYYFSKGLQATWFSAVEYCRLHGLQLIKIESTRESQLITSYLEGLGTYLDYWIAGTDAGSEKNFYWEDNQESIIYENGWKPWTAGQPDNAGNIEHCIEIWAVLNYHWNDRPCDTFRYFICEF